MDKVYAIYDMNADSWSGIITLKGLYATEEAALAAIPENLKTPSYIREATGDYVHNFTYEAIRVLEVHS